MAMLQPMRNLSLYISSRPNKSLERTGAAPCSFAPARYYHVYQSGVSTPPAPVAHFYRWATSL